MNMYFNLKAIQYRHFSLLFIIHEETKLLAKVFSLMAVSRHSLLRVALGVIHHEGGGGV